MKFKVIATTGGRMRLESLDPIGFIPAQILKPGMRFNNWTRIQSITDYNEVMIDSIAEPPWTILEVQDILEDYREPEKALRYNSWKPDWSLVHFPSLEPMVRVLEYGEKKYTVWDVSGRDNWKKPMEKKQILNSMMRHLIRLMDGEELDPESKLPHIGHIMCNTLFYSYHSNNHDQTRTPKYPTQKDPSI